MESKNMTAFPPGDFIREEVEARGWTVIDLASRLGIPVEEVLEILAAKVEIDAGLAEKLGAAFGVEAVFFINLERLYQAELVRLEESRAV